eukprot:snap_masked-scaffold_1-processed-gene-12.28-mRNA-1 protein AED:1.00 eAED:1.00 QI:0/0/0/0/1/1/2/0/491
MKQQEDNRTICCSVKTFLWSTGLLFVTSFGLFGASITAFFLTTQPVFFFPREIFTTTMFLSSYYLLTSFCGFSGLSTKKELCVILMLSVSIFGFIGQLIAHVLFFFLATGNEQILEDLGFGGVGEITLKNEERLIDFSQSTGTEELWETAQNDGNCCGVSFEAIAISVLLDGIDVIPQTHSGALCSVNQTLEDELNALLQNINQDNLQDIITQGEENENFGTDTGFFCLDSVRILANELTAIISGVRLYFVPIEKGGFFISPEVYMKNMINNSKSRYSSANVLRRASARIAYAVNQQRSKLPIPTYPVNNYNGTSREADRSIYRPTFGLQPAPSFNQFKPPPPKPDLPPRIERRNEPEQSHYLTSMKSLKNPRYDNLYTVNQGLTQSGRNKNKERRREKEKNFEVEGGFQPSKRNLQSRRNLKKGLSMDSQDSKRKNKLTVQFKNKAPSVRRFYDRLRIQSTAAESSVASPSFLAFTKGVNSKYRKRWDEE